MNTGPLYIDPADRVSLAVRNLNVTLRNKESQKKANELDQLNTPLKIESQNKILLNDISFDLEPGKVLAILGASGSGKTTLLNTLSSRMVFNDASPLEAKGMMKFNQLSPNLAYLLQQDLFVPGLKTVELLKYTAQFKLINSTSKERNELIDFLLESLNLNKIRNTIITDFHGVTTLSGGEQRRVSLALQLLTKPSILFLDEPTTGLDATTSVTLISMIKKLSVDFGITVILTIHQPRVEILELFDDICLLAKGGSMLYYGDLDQGVNYFHELHQENIDGDLANDEVNFADFLLKISSVDKYSSAKVEKQTLRRVQLLIESWRKHQKVDDSVQFVDTFEKMASNGLFETQYVDKRLFISPTEIYIIFKRTAVLTYRDLQSALMLYGILTLVAIIIGWVFYKPSGSLAGIRSVTSALYSTVEVLGFTPLTYEIERLCSHDGRFLIKEYKEDKLYSLTSWFIGRGLAKLLLEQVPISLIWSLISYYLWGLNSNSNFGIYFINNVMIFIVGIAIAHICFVLGGYQFPFASLISAVFYQFQNASSGYFINAKTMPVYVRWTKYIVPFWYSFGSLISNHFTSFMGDCTGDDCSEYSGEYVLKNLGYPKRWYAVPLVANLAFFVVLYTASCFLIWFKCKVGTIKVAKERKKKDNKLEQKISNINALESVITTEKKDTYQGEISLSLRGITLSLKQNFFKSFKPKSTNDGKILLNNLNIEFKHGLTAIMGPSGSGKTTMLNLISGRSGFRNMVKQGDVLLNNTIIPFEKLSRLTSYVVQNDSCLIPVLTVRETLYYQAKLRLHKTRHSQIDQIIQSLAKKMGLLDVLDLPIGDYSTKGISGGEKRRVSIAIQLLNEDHRILLLDEPTSGLDSFTSEHLIKLLKQIAVDFDKIIITTIHQPKYEIFEMFDSIVLLKSGNLIYDGNTKTLIKNVGFCNNDNINDNNNFADLLMDSMNDEEQQVIFSNIKEKGISYTPTSEIDNDYKRYKQLFQRRQTFGITFFSVFKREIKIILRTEGVLFSRVGQYLGLSIIHALYFSPLKHNYASISNRLGLIQEVLNLYFVGLFNNMSLYSIEREIFYQEYKDNLYSPLEFTLTYLANELPMEIVSNFILTVFIVLVIGLPRTPEMFFTMWYVCIACVNCGESVGIIFNSIFDQLGIAINVLSNLMVIAIFMGGTMSLNMPILFRAFNYISPLKYSVLALAKLGFEGQKFSCEGGATDCVLNSGESVLEQYKLDSTLWVNLVVVLAIAVIYRLLAMATIYIKVKRH